ncbi:unnamed protein product [Amoebophrya sp. A120]|nr:unnamed protein product [Amoebophrya sp. A120]|eukprot:GSA120T00018888001.1
MSGKEHSLLTGTSRSCSSSGGRLNYTSKTVAAALVLCAFSATTSTQGPHAAVQLVRGAKPVPSPPVVLENEDEIVEIQDIGLRGYRKRPRLRDKGIKSDFHTAVEDAIGRTRRNSEDLSVGKIKRNLRSGLARSSSSRERHEGSRSDVAPSRTQLLGPELQQGAGSRGGTIARSWFTDESAALVASEAAAERKKAQRHALEGRERNEAGPLHRRKLESARPVDEDYERRKALFRVRVLGIKDQVDVDPRSGEVTLFDSVVDLPDGGRNPFFKYATRRRGLAPYAPQTCTKHQDCAANHYCMSCDKCKTQTGSSTCNGDCTLSSTVGVCKPVFHCHKHADYLGGACPSSFAGCDKTADCNAYGGTPGTSWRGTEEYCMACAKCNAYKAVHPGHDCGPCDKGMGKVGFCRALSDCKVAKDSTSGGCPQAKGCRSHSDCGASEYCRDCQKCLERNDATYCADHVCPSQGGGYCYANLAACETFNDGVGGSCVRDSGCKSHTECGEGRYCMSCQKCKDYHDSLPADRKDTWHCDPCPTNAGGTCEAARWCGIANDGVSDCPAYVGCASKADCAPSEFCLAHASCVSELSLADCGTEPVKGGFCLDHSYCTASRTIDGECAMQCNGNDDCSSGEFCGDYSECLLLRGVRYCGPQPKSGVRGVCMPQEHCARGLHSPIDGKCPDHSLYSFHHPRNIVTLDDTDTMSLAIHHQAFNVWHSPDVDDPLEEYLVGQAHDDFSYAKRRDDKEYVYMWKVKKDDTVEKVTSWQTSCGSLEVIVPKNGPFVYEARISLDLLNSNAGIAECSCIKEGYPWSSAGVCPRGISTQIGSTAPRFLPLDNIQQVSFISIEDLLISNLNMTLYTLQTEVSGVAKKMDSNGCPSLPSAAADSPFHPNNAGGLAAVDLAQYEALLPKMAGMAGKFCVAKRDADCSVSVKYRYCLWSGGKGLLLYVEDSSTTDIDDLHLAVSLYSAERSRTDLIPVALVSHLDSATMTSLDANSLTLKMGPQVGGSTVAESVSASSGGVRVIEANTGTEKIHHKIFGAVTYMEPSEIRQILFVCTDPYTDPNANHASNVEPNYESKRQVRVFSTSNMDTAMPEHKPLAGSLRPSCEDSIYRDYHVVDFKRNNRYYTSFINHHHGNTIEVYDTTDLSDWKIIKELKADWEDADSGLGAMTTNADGSIHLLTWHCALFTCEGSAGSELYLLDSAHPPNRPLQGGKWDTPEAETQAWVQFMSIHSVIRLPIQVGAEGRDIACTKDNVCLVTMNTDGFVVYDVGSYDQGTGLHSVPRKIGEHANTFQQSDLPVTYKRNSGAQKVFPSRIRGDRFYIEHSTITMGVTIGASSRKADVVRNNKLWLVQSEPQYIPGNSDADRFFDASSADPIVLLTVEIKRTYDDVTKLLGVPQGMSSLEHLQATLQHGLASALRVPGGHKRFPITAVYQMVDSVEVNLEILPDKLSPSPLTMLDMLLRQHSTPTSLLHRGVLSPIASDLKFTGAYSVMGTEANSRTNSNGDIVTAMGATNANSDYTSINTESRISTLTGSGAYTVDADTAQILGLSIAFGIALLVAITVIVLFLLEQRKRRGLEKQMEQMVRDPQTGGPRNGRTLTVVGRPTREQSNATTGTVRNEASAGIPVPREAFTERQTASPAKIPVSPTSGASSSSSAAVIGSAPGTGVAIGTAPTVDQPAGGSGSMQELTDLPTGLPLANSSNAPAIQAGDPLPSVAQLASGGPLAPRT